jgi:hypothetical protein
MSMSEATYASEKRPDEWGELSFTAAADVASCGEIARWAESDAARVVEITTTVTTPRAPSPMAAAKIARDLVR